MGMEVSEGEMVISGGPNPVQAEKVMPNLNIAEISLVKRGRIIRSPHQSLPNIYFSVLTTADLALEVNQVPNGGGMLPFFLSVLLAFCCYALKGEI